MSTIVLRSVKGSPLTNTEVDDNFNNLNTDKYQSGASPSFATITSSSNLTFTGTGNRITGDFSNATQANKVAFQTSTTNGATVVAAIPNGSNTISQWRAYNGTDPDNSAWIGIVANGLSQAQLNSGITGSGTYLPMTFYTGGSERIRVDTSGNVSIGTATPSTKLTVYGTTTAESSISAECSDSGAASGPYLDLYRNSASPAANDSLGAIFFDGNNSAAAIIGYATIKNIIGSPTSGSESGILAFSTVAAGVDAERMRIHSNGNIGIGTSSPAVKLAINSTDAILLPKGTTAQQPTGVAGYLRFNTTRNEFEGYNGTAWASVGGSALSNDTSTTSSLYPVFAGATSGTALNLYTSNAKLLYKPSTGDLSSTAMVSNNGVMINADSVSSNYTIQTGTNGFSVGPLTVNSGVTITVSSGQRHVII
jgi:hypothetical protein